MVNREVELDAAESELLRLEGSLREIQFAVALQSERVMLLRRLLELETPSKIPRKSGSPEDVAVASREAKRKSTAVRLEDAVMGILAEKKVALHIGEIHAGLVARGVRIPGRGTDANIIARIIRHPGIEREKGRRGFYRLAGNT